MDKKEILETIAALNNFQFICLCALIASDSLEDKQKANKIRIYVQERTKRNVCTVSCGLL